MVTEVRMRVGEGGQLLYMCVYAQHAKIPQKKQILRVSALVCAGSFISSVIAGTLFPLCLWISFKSLIVTAVTSGETMWKWRPAGAFFFLLFLFPCLTPWSLHAFHSHARPVLQRFTEGDFSLSLNGKRLCLVSSCKSWVTALTPKLLFQKKN